jgi:hypothetical protein
MKMEFKEVMKLEKGTFLVKELNIKLTLNSDWVGKWLTQDGKTAYDLSTLRGMSYNYIKQEGK